MSKILAIIGMHRSGTSLTANWLQKNGLFIGNKLLSGGFDNINGHFEDIEILKIHEQNLTRNGFVSNGLRINLKNNFFLDKLAKEQLKKIIDKRNDIYSLWGWKEPRGTLFINDWYNLNSDIYYLAVYRHYREVVDSLERRYYYTLFKTQNIKPLNKTFQKLFYPFYHYYNQKNYLIAWIKYNQTILHFKNKFPDNCLLINISDIHVLENKILFILQEKLGFKALNISISTIFKENLLKKRINDNNLNKFSKILKVADKTLSALEIAKLK